PHSRLLRRASVDGRSREGRFSPLPAPNWPAHVGGVPSINEEPPTLSDGRLSHGLALSSTTSPPIRNCHSPISGSRPRGAVERSEGDARSRQCALMSLRETAETSPRWRDAVLVISRPQSG